MNRVIDNHRQQGNYHYRLVSVREPISHSDIPRIEGQVSSAFDALKLYNGQYGSIRVDGVSSMSGFVFHREGSRNYFVEDLKGGLGFELVLHQDLPVSGTKEE